MKKIFFFAAVLSCLGLSKCTTTRATTGTPPVILEGVSEASALLELVRATDVPYSWFSASGNGTIDWEGQRLSAKLDVRIRKDSVIWVNISKLGFDVGRMLVTPDSAFFINRIDRTYTSYGTQQFFKKYNLPADFDMFSKVFTTGAYVPPSISKSVVEPDGALYLESSSGVSARHWLDVNYLLIKSQVMDPNQHEWTAGYGNYITVNSGQKFPYHRANTLLINGVSNLFDLDYTIIEVNIPRELPFSIPSNYEKM
ncbi:MAG: DUF4292 domain-containing protein [Saprospiraceae bacterium]